MYYLHTCHVTITQTHVHTLHVALTRLIFVQCLHVTHISVTQIIDVGLILMVISDHATNTDARIDGKVLVRVLTHS